MLRMVSMDLSSKFTPFLRTVFPIASVLGLGPMVAVMRSSGEGVPPTVISLFVTSVLAGVLGQWIFWYRNLRDVTAAPDGISVAGGGREHRARWSDLEAIERPWWGQSNFARLRLRPGHPLGATVVFMLPVKLFTTWRGHPVVSHVEAAIAAARAVTPGRASLSSS